MIKWEYLRLSVSYRESGLIDFVASGLKEFLSDVAPHEWDDYLNKLGDDGWELVSVNMWNDGWDEAYYFKRPKENEKSSD